MLKRSLSLWCHSLCFLTIANSAIAADIPFCFFKTDKSNPRQKTTETCKGPHPSRASVRYTTPEGIGYKTGYTTLEAFFSPLTETWIPFLDLRGHVFDNGKLAANAGLGFRYLANSRVYGMNGYYDYRNTNRQHYNQVGAGLESLGRIWDFRINGYLPVGKKQSSFFHTRFFSFENHSLLIQRKRDVSMKGANAEIGLHVDHFKNAPLYFAGGPYYLTGKNESTWGGEFRSSIDLFQRHFRLEGNVSYDHFYRWIGQGQASINIPFGKQRKVTKKANQTCSQTSALYTRAIQRVDRFEIIPVSKQKVVSRAINPTTGDPWVFWFVDNTSSSAGTYEDPFPTLLAAQNASSPNQGIYVFPGDGTARGMDQGITLQHGQLFLGAGVSHLIATTKGTVTIPALASSSPNIANVMGDVVTLANKNTVSGFNVAVQNGNGLAGTGIHNLFAEKNVFTASSPDLDGIHLIDPSGKVRVSKSIFNGFSNLNSLSNGNGIYINLNPGSSLEKVSVTRSQFTNISDPNFDLGGNGILIDGEGGALESSTISKCNFSDISNGGVGITLFVNGGAFESSTISGCNFSDITTFGTGVVIGLGGGGNPGFIIDVGGGTLGSSTISHCNFSDITTNGTGVLLFTGSSISEGSIDNFNITNCSFNEIHESWGIFFVPDYGSSFLPIVINNVNISNCAFSNISADATSPFFGYSEGAIYLDWHAVGVLDNVNVSHNTFDNITGSASGIVVRDVFTGTVCNHFNVVGNSFTNLNFQPPLPGNFPPNAFLLWLLCQSPNCSSSSMALQILDNTFVAEGSQLPGYAAYIVASIGTVCLKFVGNNAPPADGSIPYRFIVNTPAGGVFNRTVGSDNTTNIGQFQIDPGVGAPGSCSQ